MRQVMKETPSTSVWHLAQQVVSYDTILKNIGLYVQQLTCVQQLHEADFLLRAEYC